MQPLITLELSRLLSSPGGVLEVYITGGPTYFFGLKIYTLGILLGQEICPCIFLGLKKIRIFFWVLSPSELRFGFLLSVNVEQKGG